MPHMIMDHQKDPKQAIFDALGSGYTDFKLFNNQVLCAVYVRPQKTKSGIFLTDVTTSEDKIQGKVGLVINMGPMAFIDDSNSWFKDVDIILEDWVVFKPSDGWSITVNGVLCRILDDTNVRGTIPHPDMVW